MAKHKNISNEALTVPGVGVVQPGEIRDMPEGFHNANFEQVKIETSPRAKSLQDKQEEEK